MSQIIIENSKKSELLETMKTGYEEMGTLNITLSEEGMYADLKDLEEYEKKLLESE